MHDEQHYLRISSHKAPQGGPSLAYSRDGGTHPLIALQRQAGNRAVVGLCRDDRTVALPVQRHASAEHAMLGDTPPSQLGAATVSGKTRDHLISREWSRIASFANEVTTDPSQSFPEYRWVQLDGSRLWLTYGELNALADYLPDPDTIDTLTQVEMTPVLQRMRRGMIRTLERLPLKMKGQSDTTWDYTPLSGLADVTAMDAATGGRDLQRYSALLARNACHFAPMSWHRWAHYHEEAREAAREANGGRCREVSLRDDVTAETAPKVREAWLKNGYGDHFLQDSFAAGHLVNKTLVMQWFSEYLTDLPYLHWSRLIRILEPLGPFLGPNPMYLERPGAGVPDRDDLAGMSENAQPNIAGRHLYDTPTFDRTAKQDRARGTTALDPQTAQERDKPGRIAGSGVVATTARTREEAYQLYLRMLNSSYLQFAAGAVHDWFNKNGLWVSNNLGDVMKIGGDETLLNESGKVGAERAAEAAQLSQQAIADTLAEGDTKIRSQDIFELVPTSVYVDTAAGEQRYSLEEFQDEVVHDLCRKQIFPAVVRGLESGVVRFMSPKMRDKGVSEDAAG